MSNLLKPSTLRELLSSLNTLLKDYSEKTREITGSFKDKKSSIISAYNSEKAQLTELNQKKLSKLEEEFKHEKDFIEQEKKERTKTLQEITDSERNQITQSFDETSETTRRYSREFIIQKRKENEDAVKNLNAESESLNQLLNEYLTNCDDIKGLLKKFNVKIPEENLIEATFAENEEVPSVEEQMSDYDPSPHFDRLQELDGENQTLFAKMRKSPLTSLFIKIPPILLLIVVTLIHGVLYFISPGLKIELLSTQNILISFAAVFGVSLLLILLYKASFSKRLKQLSENLGEINALADLCREINRVHLNDSIEKENLKLKNACQEEESKINEEVKDVDSDKSNELRGLKDKFNDSLQDINSTSAEQLEDLAKKQTAQYEELEKICEEEINSLKEKFEVDLDAIQTDEQQQLDSLTEKWQKQWLAKLEDFENLNTQSQEKEKELFPLLTSDLENWNPPASFEGASQFGTLKMDLKKELTFPEDGSFELTESIPFSIPALLEFPDHASMLVTTKDEGRELAVSLVKNTILRLLMTLPPGKARFNFVDPLSLGETFAGFMHLNDYKEELTGGRIATNSRQIEQHLSDLNEHMETVIQKYLRNEFDNICDYNEEVGEIAEPFRFLVVADFPVNFTEEAVRRIVSIAKSGARCGVYVIMHRDERHPVPGGFDITDIEKHSINVNYLFGDLDWKNCGFKLANFEAEPSPDVSIMNELIKKIGASSIDATRVEIPFMKVKTPDFWKDSSAEDLCVPIGLSGAKKQEITFGHGTNQHCLIAGKTGSGKSNLIHIIICNLALKYSPEELEFYLIDFKKGVEFKSYATCSLPHAKAIAIESDREFGLSVLRKIDKDLQERGEILRKAGVQNLTQYRSGGEKMSRTVLIIDEFQEIFVEDDVIAQECSLLLDRIVRQGRAFGIHVILGSQTLAGSYTLPRSTMGQMTIRIALQCSESDSYIILSENNSAARLLGRPGEAIYNDKAGLPEGNTPFQTAFLTESEKTDILKSLKKDKKKPFVFEGNIPGDISSNNEFISLLESSPSGKSQLIFGEPNAIRPALSATLEPATGQNVMIVGQNEESSLSIIISSISSLALNHKPENCEFYIFDGSSTDLPREELFIIIQESIPAQVKIIKPGEVEEAVNQLKENEVEDGKFRFLFFHGFHKFRKLKQDDSFSWDDDTPSAGKAISEIFSEGPEKNTFSVIWSDSWNSLSRMAPRKILNDFEYRILFQISQTDSVSLMDSPEATKLGLHTALLFNDQTGEALKFRPFALPGSEWFEKLKASFSQEVTP